MSTDMVAELKQAEDEIAEARALDATISGGLLKALIAVRLEILRITRAALRQGIMAGESGAPLSVQIPTTTPDPGMAQTLALEIEAQQRSVDLARADAARFTGGLVHAMKLSTVATQEQSLSMLRQRYLVARYGLHIPASRTSEPAQSGSTNTSPVPSPPERPKAPVIVKVRLLKKQFAERSHQKYIFFDTEFVAVGVKRPTRAIKGEFRLTDLFGETKMAIGWTIDRPLKPGEMYIDKAQGFQYNQFMQPHQWANATALEDMMAFFDVASILYQDGSREDL
ncbi:MAG: hypothetical protein ABI779_05475 [Acidobacteriota bacterium]